MHSLARRAPRSPRSWTPTLASILFLGGLAVLASVPAALAALVALLAVSLAVRMRSSRDRGRARQRLADARRGERETQLAAAGVRRHGLVSATTLVDRITAADPIVSAQLELEGLLDRYVVLELATARLANLVAERPPARPVPTTSPTRMEIRARSLRLRRTCEARLAAGRDELACIDELLQYLAQRSALLAAEIEAEGVSDRLALLDEALR